MHHRCDTNRQPPDKNRPLAAPVETPAHQAAYSHVSTPKHAASNYHGPMDQPIALILIVAAVGLVTLGIIRKLMKLAFFGMVLAIVAVIGWSLVNSSGV